MASEHEEGDDIAEARVERLRKHQAHNKPDQHSYSDSAEAGAEPKKELEVREHNHTWLVTSAAHVVDPPHQQGIAGVQGVPYMQLNFVCQCGAMKYVIRPTSEIEIDDPDNLRPKVPPSAMSPLSN